MKKILVIMLTLSLLATMAIGCAKEETADEPVQVKEEATTEKEEEPATVKEEEPVVVEETEPVTIKVTSGLWSKPEEQQYVREEALTAFESDK